MTRTVTYERSYRNGKVIIALNENLINQLRIKVYEESPEATAIDLLDFLEEILNKDKS